MDGGPEVLFFEHNSSGEYDDFDEPLSKVLKGNDVQIIIRANTDWTQFLLWTFDDYYSIDNIEVKEVTTFYSRSDGNWNNNNTWSVTGHSGVAVDPGIYPTRREGAMVAHDVNLSAHAQAAFLEVRSGGNVNLNARSLSMVRGGGIIVDNGGSIFGAPGSTLSIDDALTTDCVVNGNISVGNLVYNSGSGLSFTSMVIDRDFLINVSNATIDLGVPVTIGDDLEVDGSNNLFTIGADQTWKDLDLHSNTRMIFDGSGDQTLATSAGAILRDLVVNKPSGKLILNDTVTVSGSVTFTNGVIESSPASLLIFNDNATSTGANSNSYVEGPVQKTGNDNFTFPIGKDGFYAPIEISGLQSASGTTQFTAEYFTKAGPNTESLTGTFSHVSGMEYWDLDRTYDQGNNASCYVRLYFMDSDRSQILDPSDLIVAHYNGSAWETKGSGNHNGNSVRSSGRVSNFSPFTFGSLGGVNPLPVELLSFTGENTENGNLLTWKTASETNNDYFVIEKSANGADWTVCGKVSGSGTVSNPVSYEFLDSKPFYGLNYYRLKQVDYNGKFEYFPAISVNNEKELQFALEAIYPNPTSGAATAHFTATESGQVAVSIMNLQGQTLFMEKSVATAGNNRLNLDLSQLERGIYLVALQVNGEVAVLKVVKR